MTFQKTAKKILLRSVNSRCFLAFLLFYSMRAACILFCLLPEFPCSLFSVSFSFAQRKSVSSNDSCGSDMEDEAAGCSSRPVCMRNKMKTVKVTIWNLDQDYATLNANFSFVVFLHFPLCTAFISLLECFFSVSTSNLLNMQYLCSLNNVQ